MVLDEALYDRLLKEYEGLTDCAEYADLDLEECSKSMIGQKWLVVVDYHS